MIEVKFLKELPIRSLNKENHFLKINGADIYIDKDGNRFAYIEFENKISQPLFSLYFVVKQYDSFGSFIKEVNYSLASIYANRGKYITEQPVQIDNDCDGVEIYISYAEFSKSLFFKDALTKVPRLGMFIPNYYEGAPKSVSQSFLGEGQVINQDKISDEQPAKKEKTTEEVDNKAVEKVVSEKAEDNLTVIGEKTVVEEKINDDKVVVKPVEVKATSNLVKQIKLGFNTMNLILAGIGVVLIFVAIIISNILIS